MTVHLVIPDSHANPDYGNERYTWLGKLIADVKPDVVIDIGDWFDMHSLCSYDKGKAAFHGRKYSEDISAGVDAQERLLSVLRRTKRKLPRFVRTLGNHEHRINRTLSYESILEGTISLKDLQSKEYHWEEYPFLEKVNIDGVYYSHYHPSGVMGRPISGTNLGRSLILTTGVSSTQGHSHTFDHAVRNNSSGKPTHGLSVGCYIDYKPAYASAQEYMWHRGVVIKRNVEDGNYDIQWVSLDAIKKEYSGD